MANKAISELPQASNVNNQDLFVLEQSGIAKKLTAETFITEQGIIDALAEALDGHGGIASVTLSSISGRTRTYLITFTDGTTTTFQVLDGTSISRIEKTSTAGLVDTYTVFMTDGTTSFFQVRNGQDGSATWDQINSKAPIITETVTGAIVNFPDGADDIPVTSLVANIEPVQNLNGYSNPWPAGGGGNIYDQSVRRMPISISAGTTLYLRKNDATISFSVYALDENNNSITLGYLDGTEQVSVTLNVNITLISITENSANTLINHGKTLMVSLSPITEVVPYSNICPISGHTEANVTRAGKNLLPFVTGVTNVNGLTSVVNADGSLTVTGTATGTGGYITELVNLATTIEPQTPITISTTTNVPGRLRCFLDSATADIQSGSNRTTREFSSALTKVRLYLFTTANTSYNFTIYPQVELGTTATAYEPYQSNTVTVDWTTEAGTVYGGTIDVATGLLTVDRGFVTYDGSDDESWSLQSVNSYNIANFSISHTHYSGTANYLASCNYLTAQTSAIAATQTNGFLVHQNGSTIYIRLSTSYASTVAELRTWLADNPLQIVYGLTTPQTYQLTGQQLKTLYGTNNLFSNVGNVSVTYPTDTKLFIEKLTMPTEDDMVANQAITSGKYFMIGNSLYLALANIASGAQITIGTNAQRVSLADALNTINS